MCLEHPIPIASWRDALLQLHRLIAPFLLQFLQTNNEFGNAHVGINRQRALEIFNRLLRQIEFQMDVTLARGAEKRSAFWRMS